MKCSYTGLLVTGWQSDCTVSQYVHLPHFSFISDNRLVGRGGGEGGGGGEGAVFSSLLFMEVGALLLPGLAPLTAWKWPAVLEIQKLRH